MRPATSISLSALLLGACLPPLTAIDSGPLSLNIPCEPGEIDECISWGYVCDMVGAGYSCQYPEFGDPCLPSVGCDPDAGELSCDEFSVDGGPQALVPACGTPCNLPTDCLDSTSTCIPAYLPDGGQSGACQTNYCGTPFEPCPVSYDGGPGSCLPIDEAGDNACYQTGPVATNGTCSGGPIDGGAYLCQPNNQCSFGPSRTVDVCLAVCGGGQSCPGSCVQTATAPLCLTPCPPSCTSPLTCGNLFDGNGMSLGFFCTPP